MVCFVHCEHIDYNWVQIKTAGLRTIKSADLDWCYLSDSATDLLGRKLTELKQDTKHQKDKITKFGGVYHTELYCTVHT